MDQIEYKELTAFLGTLAQARSRCIGLAPDFSSLFQLEKF
jgi:hypothetical protein